MIRKIELLPQIMPLAGDLTFEIKSAQVKLWFKN